MSKSEKLVFFGSGPVAAESLASLAKNFDIEAVVTKPKPAHHRGEFPVLSLAEKLGLPVLTASGKKELDQLFKTASLRSRLAVLIDFGIIISQEVINYFPLGILNSHFSLLPQWRGADPITFAILSGQAKTGVSLMLLVPAMDEGPLLAYGEYDMPSAVTTPQLTADLIELSDSLLKDIVPKYLAGDVLPVSQTVTSLDISYSRKLTKTDGAVDWNKPAEQIEREVRAYIEWPKSRAKLNGFDIIITKSRVADSQNDGQLVAKCSPGWLEIQELRAPSGRIMSGADFLRGYAKDGIKN